MADPRNDVLVFVEVSIPSSKILERIQDLLSSITILGTKSKTSAGVQGDPRSCIRRNIRWQIGRFFGDTNNERHNGVRQKDNG